MLWRMGHFCEPRAYGFACASQIITHSSIPEILYMVIRIFKILGDTAAEQALMIESIIFHPYLDMYLNFFQMYDYQACQAAIQPEHNIRQINYMQPIPKHGMTQLRGQATPD